MEWELLILPAALVLLMALSVIIRSWLARNGRARPQDSVDEAIAGWRGRGHQ